MDESKQSTQRGVPDLSAWPGVRPLEHGVAPPAPAAIPVARSTSFTQASPSPQPSLRPSQPRQPVPPPATIPGLEPLKPVYAQQSTDLAPVVEPTPTPAPLPPLQPVTAPVPAPPPVVEAPSLPVITEPVAVAPQPEPVIQAAELPAETSTEQPDQPDKTPGLLSRHKALTFSVATVAILVGVGAGGYFVLFKQHLPVTSAKALQASSSASASAGTAIKSQKLSFTPLAPKDKPQFASAGTGGGTYNATYGTYGFIDAIDDQAVTITEQTLPKDDSAAKTFVSELTQNMPGTQASLPSSQGSAMIITDAQSGLQNVIYQLNGLLVVMQSGTTHPAEIWTAYVDSLQ